MPALQVLTEELPLLHSRLLILVLVVRFRDATSGELVLVAAAVCQLTVAGTHAFKLWEQGTPGKQAAETVALDSAIGNHGVLRMGPSCDITRHFLKMPVRAQLEDLSQHLVRDVVAALAAPFSLPAQGMESLGIDSHTHTQR